MHLKKYLTVFFLLAFTMNLHAQDLAYKNPDLSIVERVET